MKRVKNMLNADQFPTIGEINRLPSMTVPDQTMTVKEIMDRYARGLPLEGARVPMYEVDDVDLDQLEGMMAVAPENFAHLDLADRQELLEQHGDYLRFLRGQLQAYQKQYPKKTPPEANEKEPAQRASNSPEAKPEDNNSQGAAAAGK